MTSNSTVITVEGLSKHYGSKVAVDGISFEVGRSEVFGFLGPNGAGKTSTIKMLTTLIPPTAGRATVLDHDLRTEGKRIRERIGVVQQQESFDQGLNAETSMDLYGLVWNVPKEERRQRIEALIERFGMQEFRKTATVDLSGGQRRRLQVAREFVHDMDLLFLDEPTVGLDPLARRDLLNFIKEKVKAGLTVFFTTHILEEAEYLCDRIAVINNGKIITLDSPQNLKRQFGDSRTIEFKLLEGRSEGLSERLATSDDVAKVVLEESSGTYKVTTSSPERVLPEIYQLAEKLGLHISSIYIAETTLEEAFITLVEKGGMASR